ncbi:unnamed protein product [Phaeothamnion confervicola]
MEEHTKAAAILTDALRREQENGKRLEDKVTELTWQRGRAKLADQGEQRDAAGTRRLLDQKAAEVAAARMEAAAHAAEASDLRAKLEEARAEAAEAKRVTTATAAAAVAVGGTAAVGGATAEERRAFETETRRLRQQVRELEWRMRQRDDEVKALEADRESAVALRHKIEVFEARIQRKDAALHAATEAEAELDALRLERQAWLDVFEDFVRKEEESVATRAAGEVAGGDEALSPIFAAAASRGGSSGTSGGGGDSAGPASARKASPLDVMLLLRRKQEAALRLRRRAADAEQRCSRAERQLESATASASVATAKLAQAEGEATAARAAAARAAAAQEVARRDAADLRALVASYERDPKEAARTGSFAAGGGGTDGGAASRCRQSAIAGQRPSAAEAEAVAEVSARAAKLERRLREVESESKKVAQRLEQTEQELVAAERRAARGDYDPAITKVLHFSDNPSVRAAQKRSKDRMTAELAKLRDEVAMLRAQLKAALAADSGSQSAAAAAAAAVQAQEGVDQDKLNQRLKAMFRERIQCYRESVYLLTGFKVDITTDGGDGFGGNGAGGRVPPPQLKLRSMYAESADDYLLFEAANGRTLAGGLRLMQSPLAMSLEDKIDVYLNTLDSIPAFLSSVTLDLFDRSTYHGPAGGI